MGEVVSINLNRASLSEIAEYIKSLDRNNATNCWHIAESLAQAKDICEESGERWAEYCEEQVGYSERHANAYVRVCEVVGSRGSELAEKGCSFNTLQVLAARDLPKAERKRLIDKMAKKKYIDQKYCAEIQQEARAAIPQKVVTAEFKQRFIWKPFQERLNEYINSAITPGPEYLFGLSLHLPSEEAKTYIKVWKQKYHPDKGGKQEEFSAICHAEEAFIEQQKEKEAGK